jgi:hypothetical protein
MYVYTFISRLIRTGAIVLTEFVLLLSKLSYFVFVFVCVYVFVSNFAPAYFTIRRWAAE